MENQENSQDSIDNSVDGNIPNQSQQPNLTRLFLSFSKSKVKLTFLSVGVLLFIVVSIAVFLSFGEKKDENNLQTITTHMQNTVILKDQDNDIFTVANEDLDDKIGFEEPMSSPMNKEYQFYFVETLNEQFILYDAEYWGTDIWKAKKEEVDDTQNITPLNIYLEDDSELRNVGFILNENESFLYLGFYHFSQESLPSIEVKFYKVDLITGQVKSYSFDENITGFNGMSFLDGEEYIFFHTYPCFECDEIPAAYFVLNLDNGSLKHIGTAAFGTEDAFSPVYMEFDKVNKQIIYNETVITGTKEDCENQAYPNYCAIREPKGKVITIDLP